MSSIAEFIPLAARLLLAFVFLLAGATKLVDPVEVRNAWRDFGLPSALARPAVIVLPLSELAVAVALIPTGLAWYGAWGALALLIVFLLVIAIAMARGRKPDCRCFGRLHSAPVGRAVLVRDTVLAACAAWLVWGGPKHTGPDLWAWVAGLDASHRKEALVAACVAGFVFFRLLDRARPESQSIASQWPDWNDDDEGEPEQQVRPQAPAPARHRQPPARPAPVEMAAPVRIAEGIGLPIGSPAPAFELPGITGERRSLQTLLQGGKDLLLVFSSPFCEPCHALIPHLGKWSREQEGKLNIVLVSRGTPADNIPKLKGFDSTRVLLQRGFGVAEAYDVISTPTGVLVDVDGRIRSELAVGRAAIQELIASWSKDLAKGEEGPGNQPAART